MSETEINSIGEASSAIAAYEPPQVFGLTVRKVPWMKLPELMETLDVSVNAIIQAFREESPEVSAAPLLRSSASFLIRLSCVSTRLSYAELEKLDLDWDQGAQLAALALQVNIQDLKAVIGFFAGALKGALAGFQSKPNADGSEPSKPDVQ